jgi:hypothetical protein
MHYDFAHVSRGAVVSQRTTNLQGIDVGVIVSGFGFDAITSDRPGLPDRFEHLHDILTWLQNLPPYPVGADPQPYRNSLGQNYPNPFNPVTTIEYSLKNDSPVSIRVYNAAGQLVKTLVGPGESKRRGGHRVVWDGTNDSGVAVSSGVYFCRMKTEGFTMSRKLVVIK